MSRLRKGIVGTITAAGLLAVSVVGNYEGLRLYAYQDVIGVWTACYGETKGIKPGMKFTKDQCDVMFIGSLEDHEKGMRKCLRNPDAIPDKPYVAFLSLTYNIGVSGFCNSSIPQKLNAGNIEAACKTLPSFNKAGGRVNKGLVNRRASELKLCLSGASAERAK